MERERGLRETLLSLTNLNYSFLLWYRTRTTLTIFSFQLFDVIIIVIIFYETK